MEDIKITNNDRQTIIELFTLNDGFVTAEELTEALDVPYEQADAIITAFNYQQHSCISKVYISAQSNSQLKRLLEDKQGEVKAKARELSDFKGNTHNEQFRNKHGERPCL
jgi:hypothetical protein